MKKIVLIASTLIIFLSFCFGIIFGPGLRKRKQVQAIYSSKAKIDAYIDAIGKPSVVYRSFAEFSKSDAYILFPISNPNGERRYLFWAKEGIPYYWVLVVITENDDSVEICMIKAADIL
jgi:hypothetical protein